MSLQDPISDMLTCIRNAQVRSKQTVRMPSSKIKVAIAEILENEGYINGFNTSTSGSKTSLTVELKYFEGKFVIELLQRVSRPSLRKYRGKNDIDKVMNGLGIVILSTSKGLMTDKIAREQGIGGEILCIVA